MADIRGGVASSNPEYLTPHEPRENVLAATAEPDGRDLWALINTKRD